MSSNNTNVLPSSFGGQNSKMGLPGQNQGDDRLSSFWRLQGRARLLVFSGLARLFTFLGLWPLSSSFCKPAALDRVILRWPCLSSSLLPLFPVLRPCDHTDVKDIFPYGGKQTSDPHSTCSLHSWLPDKE